MAARLNISAILFGVRRSLVPWILGFVACIAVFSIGANSQEPAPTPPSAQPTPNQAPQQTQPPSATGAPPAATVQSSVATPVHTGPMIVINPAHGGTDTGARGENGLTEKEQVLMLARMVRSDLLRNGFHVILTRDDDSNPSYEDRSAIANAYHDAIFISLHVASTGKFGTVRAYSYQYSTPLPPQDDEAAAPAARAPNGLVPWEEAQRSHLDASKRLADILQTQFSTKFSGSPQSSTQYAVRDLRSVNAPAVAIEISSVAVSDPNSILALGGPLSIAVVRSVQVFRPAPAPILAPAPGGQP
ncbi:MAG: N-acetylmuramoyl-L-alanine amidase [Candidatus Acidiferrales bacterium]